MVKSSSGKEGYRSFTVVEVGKHGGCKTKFNAGRYVNKTPAGAARKAFTEHCRIKKIRGVCTLIVSVKETTQGSNGKVYSYKLNRRKLKEPVIRLEGQPGEYLIEYKTDAKSTEVPVPCRNKGQTVGRKAKKTKRKIRLSPNNVRKMRSRKAKKVNNNAKKANNKANHNAKKANNKANHNAKKVNNRRPSLQNTLKRLSSQLFNSKKNNGVKVPRRSRRIAARAAKAAANKKKN